MNNRKLLQLKADTLTDSEVAEVLEYLDIMQSLSQPPIRDNLGDELILHLLYGNRRRVRQGVANGDRSAHKKSNHSLAS